MTYCIGFKRGSLACLIADAAVTGPDPVEAETSFGELQDSAVSERALKLFRLPGAALTFSGKSRLGRDFITQFRVRLAAGMDVTSALEASAKNVMPLASPSDLQVLCAWSTPVGGRLTSFNAKLDLNIFEHDDLVQIGSADDIRKVSTAQFLSVLGGSNLLTPTQIMVGMTALCQSYGVHDNALPRGIGGAFTAISAGPDGIRWQPDTAYLFYHPGHLSGSVQTSSAARPTNLKGAPIAKTVLACVHEDVLALRSTVATGNSRSLMNSTEGEPLQTIRARAEAASHYSAQVASKGSAEYLALLSTAFRLLVLCETRGYLSHRDLILRPTSTDQFSCSFSPRLTRLMSEHRGSEWVGFHFLPYDPIRPPEQGTACPCGSRLDYANCHAP
jgi:hypothetical protein